MVPFTIKYRVCFIIYLFLIFPDPSSMKVVDTIFTSLTYSLNQRKCSMYGRDNVMELLIKFIQRRGGLGWCNKFIAEGGRLSIIGTNKRILIKCQRQFHVSNLLFPEVVSHKGILRQ